MGSVRRDLLVLGLVAFALFTLGTAARDLWNPNEPLYGEAVVEMDAAGDWLVPRVNGQLFDEKPILYFWLALISAALFGGIDEWSLRLPSALAGVALVLLTYSLVRPYADRRRARLAAGLLATTFVVFWSARRLQMDLLLAACCLAAIVAVTRVVDHGARPWLGGSLAGAAMGLGFLAKGPVGLICPGIAVLLYLGTERRWGELRTLGPVAAAAAFLLVGAPWYLLLAAKGETAFLGELLFRQNVERFVAPWDHQAPWWYYLKYLVLDMLPWSPFLVVAIGLPAQDEGERRLSRLAWVWLVGVVLFFSLSASKRSPYILPVAPAVALLAAGVIDRLVRGALDRRRRIACWTILAVFGLGLLPGSYLLAARAGEFSSSDPDLARAGRAAAGLLAAGALAIFTALAGRRRRQLGVAALGAFVVAFYLFGALRLLPAINPQKSHRPMCEEIRRHVGDEQSLRGYHAWKWRASYSYYTGRPIPRLATIEELEAYWTDPDEVFLIVEEGLLDEARQVIGSIPALVGRRTGDNAAYLFSNRQGDGGK